MRITGYDPYAKDHRWTAKASDGTEYTGAEVTSEGFQIFGLPPYGYYSAGIACYLSGPGSNDYMQDNHDVWRNGMDLKDLRHGSIVGFKYFGFGGLAQDTKGVRAFRSLAQMPEAQFHACITTNGGKGRFRIHVMIDGPYANALWKGREIAVIEADCTERPHTQDYAVPYDAALNTLAGKHAVYLVVEADPDARFTLHGLGFYGPDTHMPTVPQVTITADGRRLNIPAEPIRSSNANGYTEVNRYQLYAPLQPDTQLQATASDPDVTFAIGPVVEGRATIRATYHGQTKIYLIN